MMRRTAGRLGDFTMLGMASRGAILAAGILLAACGGDDDGGGAQLPIGDNRGGDPTPTTSSSDNSGGGAGGGAAGAVTKTTEPGQALVEVDGETIVYRAAGSSFYTCDILDDRITVNFQTGDGHDLLIQGSLQASGWVANVNFKAAGASNVQYGATIPVDADAFGLGNSAMSFEGTVSRIKDFDIANAERVPATIAVNCASPGGDPTAQIGDETYVFRLSGAQSVQCDVTPDQFEVRINRLSTDDLQLEAQGRQQSGAWLGNVTVYAGSERFTSTFVSIGTGLDIEGSTLNYEGTFTSTGGEELEGSISVTCE